MILRSRDNTPAPLLNMDREHEEQMINNFRSEMEEKMKEKEREQQEEKQEREKKEEEVEEAEVATKVMEVVTEEVVSEVESQEGQTEPALPKDESIKVFINDRNDVIVEIQLRLRCTQQQSTTSCLSRRWRTHKPTRSPTARR